MVLVRNVYQSGPMMLLGRPTNAEIRRQIAEWHERNGWSWAEMTSAMRAWGLSNIPGAERLEEFSRSSRICLHDHTLRSLRRFMVTFPSPPPFAEMVEQLARDQADRIREKQEYVACQIEMREQERAAHERAWLSRERPADGRPARKSPHLTNPLFGLDKATIRALSGGTL